MTFEGGGLHNEGGAASPDMGVLFHELLSQTVFALNRHM